MTNKIPISSYWTDQIISIQYISFWENGEMAYSAIKRINELKADNQWYNAEIMLNEWII